MATRLMISAFLSVTMMAAGRAIPAQAGRVASEEVRGGWIGELPCVPTSVGAPSSDLDVAFSCVSGTTWDGTWTGHTHYVVTGTFNAVTGDGDATIDETLVGIVTAEHAAGTLHLAGTVRVNGTTNTAVVDEQIVDGTGAFAGSTGHVVFEGFQVSGVVGHGGYHGTWYHP